MSLNLRQSIRASETVIKAKLNDFTPEDGQDLKKWDFSSPIFEHFLILGPQTFEGYPVPEWYLDSNPATDPAVLYEFPCGDAKTEFQIGNFIFADKLKFEKNKIMFSAGLVQEYQKPITIVDRSVLIRSEAGEPLFTFAAIVRGSALNCPSTDNPFHILNFLHAHKTHNCHSSLFALAFVTKHPFFDLFFSLLDQLVSLENLLRCDPATISFLKAKPAQKPDFSNFFPPSSFVLRQNFLQLLLNTTLPSFGENFATNFRVERQNLGLSWRMPLPENIPFTLCRMGFKPLLDWISIDDFVELLAAILIEESVVVVGSAMNDVVRTVTFATQLIAPFTWMGPIITMLPRELLEVMDSPCSTILGVLSAFNAPPLEDRVWIDLDKRRICFPEEMEQNANLLVPGAQKLKEMIMPLFDDRANWVQENAVPQFMKIIASYLTNQITDVAKSCLESRESSEGIFGTRLKNEEFVSKYEIKDRTFIKRLMETQQFQVWKEQACKIETERLKPAAPMNLTMTLGGFSADLMGHRRGTGTDVSHFNHY